VAGGNILKDWYDLLEQSCYGSSWRLEAWTHAFQYIKYGAEVVNQIAVEGLLYRWIKFNGNSLTDILCSFGKNYVPCSGISIHQ
jgi:hypothetical protein